VRDTAALADGVDLMPRIYKSPARDAVNALLADGEPRTIAQIADELGLKQHSVSSAVIHARKRYGAGTGGFVIVNYSLQRGNGGREAPLYLRGFNGLFDAPRPAFGIKTIRAAKLRYAKKMRVVINGKTTKSRGKTQNHWLQILGMRQHNYQL